ncbi:TonB-dependent receptor [Dysgonomonas sp. Marseille-P4677]|uniref:SusC/RagA family TonB-linked outer membrane protein n=1 Tax=Dysgonomonas sp. Marseille-P4677 TaxID=2364790 RepID=UPI001911D022|nr:TonB-dependent receptor [Dysgonomonas sp. Marseille-P4677]MBK5720026.1 TonB-dependent receptor [Dysgonomonas sp. Marseille-P4677]
MKYIFIKKSFTQLKHVLLLLIVLAISTQYISASVNTAQQTPKEVTGKVFDSTTKETLPGVSIVVKGTNTGVMSDIDGNFKIKVPYQDATLIFSYIGYQPQQIELKGRTSLEVSLVEDIKALEEVVVVGYTTQKRESITGAVATITTKDLVQSPTANINNALAGRLPGLIVNQFSGGEPGVDKAELFIRGKSTYGDQSPIVIVDGVERDMSYLAADEIETFTILKDAASTAPYGIRGANGVIVVTTKRGKASEKASVNFKASFGFNNVGKTPNLLGSADYATLYNEASRNDAMMNGTLENYKAPFTSEAIDNFRMARGDNSDGLGYNWDYFDYMFKSAAQQDYNLSVRGGTDKVRYFVMAGHMNQGTNYKHIDLSDYDASPSFKRYNFRSNIDVDITDKFWVKLDLGARITDRTNIGSSASRLVNIAMTQPPYLPITLEQNDNTDNQNYYITNPKGMLFGDQIYRFNLLGELSRTGYHTQKFTYLEGSFSMGYDLDFITKGLKIEGTFSYDSREEQWINREVGTYDEGYRKYPSYATFKPKDGIDIYRTPGHYEGAYSTGNKYNTDQTVGNKFEQKNPSNRTYYQAKLMYQSSFGQQHNVTGMFLFNRSTEGQYDGDKVRPDHRYQGLTGQFTYNFSDRYFAEFNFGYNGSENFAKEKRYGFFPAGSVGWVITNESFMNGTKSWLDFFKIRGSYGLVGSDKLPGGRFGYLQFFEGGEGYSFGEGGFNTNPGGWREGALANKVLTWEKAKKLNIGVDANFLKQRLRMSFDYFHENRYDILTELKDDKLGFPDIVGKDAPRINSGKVKNHGFELELTWSDKIGRDFRYFIKPNFTFARNRVDYMNEVLYEYVWRRKTGQPLDVNMLYVFDHFVADQAEADRLNSSGYQPWGTLIPGDAVYKDLDGDGVVTDQNDRMAMGYPRSPEIQFGLPITLQYKGFDFSVLFQGATNSTIMLKDAAVFDFPNFDQDKIGRVRPMHLDRWTPETAATAKYPALHIGTHSNNKNENSSLFMYDGSYVRLKNIELGYTLPSKIIRVAGLSNVRVYAQAQNLATWDKLGDVDVDPEIRNGGGDWYPILKVFNFGVDITF